MKAFMFPGQGSQIKGMGGKLFDEFNDLTEKANSILDFSIKELCLEDPGRQLHLTQFTQPALYVVNAMSYIKKLEENNQKPDFVCGHSLGEYNALLASGGFDFEMGLKMVKKRGELMSKASGGAMAAVLGLTETRTTEILKDNNLLTIDIANLNTPLQIVLSGLKEDIDRAQPFFEMDDVNYIPLNVSAAFHSRYMQKAKEEYESFLKDFTFSKLTIPVISNVSARPYVHSEMASNLANQLRSPVRWSESIKYLMEQDKMEFEELGTGDVLTKIVVKVKDQISFFEKTEHANSINPTESETEDKVSTDPNSRPSLANSVTSSSDTVESEGDSSGESAYKKETEELHEKIETWNKRYGIGTKVRVIGYNEVLKTRTEAVILLGHRGAIYMQGYNGYFALDEVTPLLLHAD